MDDYISREAAIQAIEDIDENAGARGSGFTDPERIMRDSAFCALEAIQPADVRPVVHGEWRNAHPSSPLLDGGGPPYCSVCGKEVPLRSVEVNQWKLERGSLSGPEVVYKTKYFLSNFCPNCGAGMREPQMLKNASQNADADVMMPAT